MEPMPAPKTRAAINARTAVIQKELRQLGETFRENHPWIARHQDAVGMTIFVGSILGVAASGWAYLQGLLPAWVTVPMAAIFLSFLHELEHDLIHKLYFANNPFVHNIMMAGVWLMRPNTVNPWIRRKLHLHHHKESGAPSDLEERGITNGEPFGWKRLVMLGDAMFAIYLRYSTMHDVSRAYAEAQRPADQQEYRRVVRETRLLYFPLGAIFYLTFRVLLVYWAASAVAWATGHPLNLQSGLATFLHRLEAIFVVIMGPNLLRSFCLHFVSSNVHYYGDIDNTDIVQQTQVWTSPLMWPFQLFCFNFGGTHAIHHFVVRDPFYIRQAIAPEAHEVMKAHGVRFNDFGTFRRANRYHEVPEEAPALAEAV